MPTSVRLKKDHRPRTREGEGLGSHPEVTIGVTSRGNDRDERESPERGREVQRQDIGGIGGKESWLFSYHNHELILLCFKVFHVILWTPVVHLG